MSETPNAGWYPNPENPAEQRYWDGTRWTEHTAPLSRPASGAPAAQQGYRADSGGQFQTGQQAPEPWLWQSIVATLLCCLPAGIVGIVFASQSQTAASRGDLATAQRKADQARTWTLVSVGLGVAGVLIGFFFVVLGAGVSSSGF